MQSLQALCRLHLKFFDVDDFKFSKHNGHYNYFAFANLPNPLTFVLEPKA
jgi:hypothetical protein